MTLDDSYTKLSRMLYSVFAIFQLFRDVVIFLVITMWGFLILFFSSGMMERLFKNKKTGTNPSILPVMTVLSI